MYGDYTHARTAAGKLDGGVCGALKLRAVIKTKDRAPGQRALKKSRLIVRNLPFNVCSFINRLVRFLRMLYLSRVASVRKIMPFSIGITTYVLCLKLLFSMCGHVSVRYHVGEPSS